MKLLIIIACILSFLFLAAYGEDESTEEDDVGMVLIPAGEFEMGDHFNEGLADELPVHTVSLDDFYMDVNEVTNAQYKKFVEATGHREPKGYGFVDGEVKDGFEPWKSPYFNGDNQPVVCVSWHDAMAYAQWAGKRLPTEAEWEKAARGGLILLCHLAKKSLVARICNSMLHIGQRQTNRMATDFLMPIERTGCARTS